MGQPDPSPPARMAQVAAGRAAGEHRDTLQVGDCPAESQLLRRRHRGLGLSPSCASGFLDMLRTSA